MSNNKENNKILHLVIGESIPDNVPDEFDKIILYVRTKKGDLEKYSDINLPCMINYSNFLDVTDDPRYYFYENYDSSISSCRNLYTLKPLGMKKGFYRVLDGTLMKIANVEPLIHEEEYKPYVLQRKSKDRNVCF